MFSTYCCRRIARCSQICSKTDFASFLLAWAPVNSAPLAVFTQLLSTCLNQEFWTFQWYIKKNNFTDVYKTWGNAVKASLFTGAQASKKARKSSFLIFGEIELLRIIDSEMSTKLEQRQSRAPFSRALKQAKSWVNLFLNISPSIF